MSKALDGLLRRLLESARKKLAFKEEALRYCNHSKKRDKLASQVAGLRKLTALYESYKEEDTE